MIKNIVTIFFQEERKNEKKNVYHCFVGMVLDIRALYPDSSLADLYDPITMPPDLSKAHTRLDIAIGKAYGTVFKKEDCVADLMKMYVELTTKLKLIPDPERAKFSGNIQYMNCIENIERKENENIGKNYYRNCGAIVVLWLLGSWSNGGQQAFEKGYHSNDAKLQQSQQAADEAWIMKENGWTFTLSI